MAIRAENLIRSIRMDLGQDRGFGLDVPLSDSMITAAIKTAIVEYGRYHPKFSYQSFLAPVDKFEYTPDPKVRGIRQLNMVPVTSILPITLPEMALIGGQFITWGSAIDYSIVYQYATYLQWKEAADTVFSNKPAYTYIPEVNKLYIYSPSRSVNVSFVGEIDWYTGLEEELLWDPAFNNGKADPLDQSPSEPHYTLLDKALSEIPENHIWIWIRKLALADSMKKLGRMFSRYGSIPGVDGKDIQLNGPALLEEGKEMWEETITQVRLSAVSLIPPQFR